MIDLGTLAGPHEYRHELHAYCLRCDRWTVLDLAGMVRQGRGSLRLPLRVTCRDCDERGGSGQGVAGSAAMILTTLWAGGPLPADLHTPVKACPPVGVVRIPTFARVHGAFD